jgi:hypothetical protein
VVPFFLLENPKQPFFYTDDANTWDRYKRSIGFFGIGDFYFNDDIIAFYSDMTAI